MDEDLSVSPSISVTLPFKEINPFKEKAEIVRKDFPFKIRINYKLPRRHTLNIKASRGP